MLTRRGDKPEQRCGIPKRLSVILPSQFTSLSTRWFSNSFILMKFTQAIFSPIIMYSTLCYNPYVRWRFFGFRVIHVLTFYIQAAKKSINPYLVRCPKKGHKRDACARSLLTRNPHQESRSLLLRIRPLYKLELILQVCWEFFLVTRLCRVTYPVLLCCTREAVQKLYPKNVDIKNLSSWIEFGGSPFPTHPHPLTLPLYYIFSKKIVVAKRFKV